MAVPKQEDYVFYQGEKFQVEFYYTEKGDLPAKEYLDASAQQIQGSLGKTEHKALKIAFSRIDSLIYGVEKGLKSLNFPFKRYLLGQM